MTRLIIVRHGESTANRQKVFAGHFDADLEERGIQQAKKTAEFIKKEYSVDKIYASDLKRAWKTGLCIGEALGLEVTPCRGIREIHAGLWEGRTHADIEKEFGEEFSLWRTDPGKSQTPGGESVVEAADRVVSAFTKIAEENDGKTVVCATHATPIRIMQTIAQKGDILAMKDVPWTSNASVSIFDYDNGKWKVVALSLDSHLSELSTTLPANV